MKIVPAKPELSSANNVTKTTTTSQTDDNQQLSSANDFFSTLVASMVGNQTLTVENAIEVPVQGQILDNQKDTLIENNQNTTAFMNFMLQMEQPTPPSTPVNNNKVEPSLINNTLTKNKPEQVNTNLLQQNKMATAALTNASNNVLQQAQASSVMATELTSATSAEWQQLMTAETATDGIPSIPPPSNSQSTTQTPLPTAVTMSLANTHAAAPEQHIENYQPIFTVDSNNTPALETVFTMQHGVAQVHDDQNKYIRSLVNLGLTINTHTANYVNADAAGLVTSQPLDVKETNYVANPTSQPPELDVKIDLLKTDINQVLNETYNANIKIYPPELGAVLAKLKINKNNAELVIITENARVKEIVQANLPQLRESFLQADINLTTIQIDIQHPTSDGREQSSQQPQPEFAFGQESNSAPAKPSAPSSPKAQRIDSIIDTYA